LEDTSTMQSIWDCLFHTSGTLGLRQNLLKKIFTPRKTLIDLEQVVPVVPHGTFSVMTLKVP